MHPVQPEADGVTEVFKQNYTVMELITYIFEAGLELGG
jgi:hypothetical protein